MLKDTYNLAWSSVIMLDVPFISFKIYLFIDLEGGKSNDKLDGVVDGEMEDPSVILV